MRETFYVVIRIKIIYFVEKYPYKDQHELQENYTCGGSEFAAMSLATAMANIGNDVLVITTNKDSFDDSNFNINPKILRLGTWFKLFNRHITPSMLKKIWYINGDIIHVHVCTEPFFPFYALCCAKFHNKPLVLTCHVDAGKSRDFISLRDKVLSKIHGSCISRIYSFANIIITPSDQFAKSSNMMSNSCNNIIAIPNGVDAAGLKIEYSKAFCRETLGIGIERNIILFVGNPHPNKGLDVLIKAMKEIESQNPLCDLVVIGDGAYKDELKDFAERIGVRNIYFRGYISDTLKKLYYKSSDVFVLPSFFDVNPLVLLEASAFGLPLVVSDIAAFRGFIKDDYNGVITKLGDEADLAAKLIQLIRNPVKCKQLGENARKNIESLSWENIAQETEDLYRSLKSNV